ncbi:hypothetical protein FB45DRAFT_864965 [Roridomyces roridus]|uniref:Uncharacterized protein n=1 Tax=Roridomyces roridus TaxID=1738132 RepID=A0AAD7C2D6_9AGAR|nr:hypothetical protein FB45DRAFT_864965 [Roridomyces roridus]
MSDQVHGGIANNEGWNCYLRVNVQGLCHTPPFAQSLAEGCPLEADCDNDKCTHEILCDLVLHQRAVASLLLHQRAVASLLLRLEEQLESEFVSFGRLWFEITWAAVITGGGVMLEGFQQDSQELLCCLLRNLCRVCISDCKLFQNPFNCLNCSRGKGGSRGRERRTRGRSLELALKAEAVVASL